MVRQGKKDDITGPDSAMVLDDGDIESIKSSDQLGSTIPMTSAVMSPFATQHTVELTSRIPIPEPEDEKTVKVRVPEIAELNTHVPDKLAVTMTGIAPEVAPSKAALPFREGAPEIASSFQRPMFAAPAGEFTGTLTLSLDAQLRAEIKQATPFGGSPPPLAPAASQQASALPRQPAYVPIPAPAPQPADVFRAQAPASPVAFPPRTIGESAVAGVFAIPLEALLPDPVPTNPVQVAPTRPEPLVLLYLERTSMARIVRKPVWQKILDAMEDEPIDPEADDPALSSDPAEIQQQAQAYAILKHGRVVGFPAAEAALEAAVAKPGRFAPPIELFEGELEPIFDDVERLRGLVTVLVPLAGNDEKLGQTLRAASQLLEAAGTTNIAPLARRQRAELQAAYQMGKRTMSFDEVDMLVSRGMLEQRKYMIQTVFGSEHLCALFHVPGHDKPQLVYIPALAGPFFPLSPRFLTRMIAEVHFPQDERETQSLVIRGLAVSKVVRKRG